MAGNRTRRINLGKSDINLKKGPDINLGKNNDIDLGKRGDIDLGKKDEGGGISNGTFTLLDRDLLGVGANGELGIQVGVDLIPSEINIGIDENGNIGIGGGIQLPGRALGIGGEIIIGGDGQIIGGGGGISVGGISVSVGVAGCEASISIGYTIGLLTTSVIYGHNICDDEPEPEPEPEPWTQEDDPVQEPWMPFNCGDNEEIQEMEFLLIFNTKRLIRSKTSLAFCHPNNEVLGYSNPIVCQVRYKCLVKGYQGYFIYNFGDYTNHHLRGIICKAASNFYYNSAINEQNGIINWQPFTPSGFLFNSDGSYSISSYVFSGNTCRGLSFSGQIGRLPETDYRTITSKCGGSFTNFIYTNFITMISSVSINGIGDNNETPIVQQPNRSLIPPMTTQQCCDELKALVIAMYAKLGLQNLPIEVPSTVIQSVPEQNFDDDPDNDKEPEEPEPTTIETMMDWLVYRELIDDERFGQWELAIFDKDIDPLTEGDQERLYKIPNLAEAILELLAKVISMEKNLLIANQQLYNCINQAGLAQVAGARSYYMSEAIADYLGVELRERVGEALAAFDDKAEDYINQLKPGKTKFKKVEWDGDPRKDGLKVKLHSLLQAADIIRSQNFYALNKKGDIKQQIMNLINASGGIANWVNRMQNRGDNPELEALIQILRQQGYDINANPNLGSGLGENLGGQSQ